MSDLDRFVAQLERACADDTFVKLTLSSPARAGDRRERVIARIVELKGVRQLAFTEQEARRDTAHNLAIDVGIERVRGQLGAEWRSAMLATTAAGWQLRFDKAGTPRLIKHPAPKAARNAAPPARVHDQARRGALGASAQPWLEALGVLDSHGRPRSGMARKHQQIDRYAEILGHLVRDSGLATLDRPVSIVDVGCGRGSLTFAAWHLLRNELQRDTSVLGVETREDLVATANAAAARCGTTELRFATGDIETVELPQVDALIALHACNTATDHAIRRGIEANATLIVCAPCCHQEVRPLLGTPAPLGPVLRHGLFAERMAEWVTDGLRALVLEWAGYRTKAIEFVDSEHTPKNLMLAGVRDGSRAFEPEARHAIDEFRAFFGIGQHALDPILTRHGG